MNLLKTFNAESIFFNAFFIKSCQHCFFKRPFYRMGRVHISALGFRFLGFDILHGWSLGLSPIPVINLIFVIYYWNGMTSIAVINHKYEIYYQNGGQKNCLGRVGQNGHGLGFGPTHPYLFTKYFISKV